MSALFAPDGLSAADMVSPVPRARFRRFLAFVLHRPLVLLVDHDGATNARVAWRDALDRWCATRVGCGIRDVVLLKDGTVANGYYCKRWISLNARASALTARGDAA